MSVSLRFSYRIYPRALINIRKFYSHALKLEVAHAAWDHDRCPCYKRNVQKLKDDIFGDLIK
jgi:hypothetical protein